MRKRFLSILFALCIMLCLVPVTVFAEGNAGEILGPNDGAVYHSGDVIPVRWTLNTIKADDKMTVELLEEVRTIAGAISELILVAQIFWFRLALLQEAIFCAAH